MAFKKTRKRTGSNSWITKTFNRKTGKARTTYSWKSPDGTTRSTSWGTGAPAKTRRNVTYNKGYGWFERISRTIGPPKSKRGHSKRSASFIPWKWVIIAIVAWLIFR